MWPTVVKLCRFVFDALSRTVKIGKRDVRMLSP